MKTQPTALPSLPATLPSCAKHTPGPWSADKWAPGYSVSAPDSQYTICRLEDCNNEEANAHLIAAAPDLLAALEDALTWMETYKRYNGISDSGPLAHAIDTARAAIARARGQGVQS